MSSASDYIAHIRSLFINLVRDGILRRQTLPLDMHIINFYSSHRPRLVGHSRALEV